MNNHNQSGAALIEAVLICVAMVSLLVAIPKLALHQDVRQTAVDASRYATWQMTVSNEVDREKVIDRLFSIPDAPIRSDNSLLDSNPFWQNNRSPLVRHQAFTPVGNANSSSFGGASNQSKLDTRTLNISTQQRVASTGTVADTVTGTIRTVSNWLGDSDAIAPDRGIIESDIQIALRTGNDSDIGPMNCAHDSISCLSTSGAILVDGWEAKDSSAVEAGAQVMVPSKLLQPVGELFSWVSIIPLMKEFRGFGDGLGCVNTTSLPTKELTGELQLRDYQHEC